ncbi:hypothetical protein A3Q56_00523 [Intoshia linei]|uniref:Uncharacterized protein n=1 Tax=Intoshia linei TaxID=1819745 RepID=A0A177BBI6_9BILA|nr:hypothetical protein A3Q56_00523 [Intoshia linei]
MSNPNIYASTRTKERIFEDWAYRETIDGIQCIVSLIKNSVISISIQRMVDFVNST